MYLNGRISRILRHSYLFDWLIFFKDILEFDFATHPLQIHENLRKKYLCPPKLLNFETPFFEFDLSSPFIYMEEILEC